MSGMVQLNNDYNFDIQLELSEILKQVSTFVNETYDNTNEMYSDLVCHLEYISV